MLIIYDEHIEASYMIIIYDHHDRDLEPGRGRDIGPRRSLDMGLGRDRHWDRGPGHLRIPSTLPVTRKGESLTFLDHSPFAFSFLTINFSLGGVRLRL